MAAYLDGGGKMFISGQDYIWTKGFTPFIASYLGVGSYAQDVRYWTALGEGSAFSGLGPYNLSFPVSNWSDSLSPAPGAEIAFFGQFSNGLTMPGGVSKIGPSYRTIFLGFPVEALPTAEAREEVLGAALEFLGTIFADVSPKFWAKDWIEAIYRAGITTGCAGSPLRYCPGDTVTRDQMAAFLIRSLEGPGYVPPPCTSNPFSDVPAASFFCPYIQDLAARGITVGCGGGQYCPASPVTRWQMAIFLLRALEGGSYTPAPCTTSPFTDVPVSSPACPWVRDLAARGITTGCAPGKYCPDASTTRAEMAVFLVRAFGIPLP